MWSADVPGDVAGRPDRVEGVGMGRELPEQCAERPPVFRGVQACQYELLGGPQPPVEVVKQPAAPCGRHDAPGAVVGRVRAPFDEPGTLEVVKQVGHHRAVDPEVQR